MNIVITDRFYFTNSYYGPAGSSIEGPSLSEEAVDAFIANLARREIRISEDSSEKEIEYAVVLNKEEISCITKKSWVPLYFLCEAPVKTLGYQLRDEQGLEVKLENYHNPKESSAGRIGGPQSGEKGIVCEFKYEGRVEATSLVKKVKEALYETEEFKKV